MSNFNKTPNVLGLIAAAFLIFLLSVAFNIAVGAFLAWFVWNFLDVAEKFGANHLNLVQASWIGVFYTIIRILCKSEVNVNRGGN